MSKRISEKRLSNVRYVCFRSVVTNDWSSEVKWVIISPREFHCYLFGYVTVTVIFIIFVLENKSWAINQFLLGSFLAILLLLVLVWIDFGFILKLGMAFHSFSRTVVQSIQFYSAIYYWTWKSTCFILFEVIESVIFAVKRYNELIHNFRAKKVDFE